MRVLFCRTILTRILCLGAVGGAVAAPAQEPSYTLTEKPRPEYPRDKEGWAIVPMFFPVAGKPPKTRRKIDVFWVDTFAPNGERGWRQHHGQDLMVGKMRPLVACFDGTVWISYAGPGGHHTLTIEGDNGYRATYMHINNDTPGTDDGQGQQRHAFAPGLTRGQRVRAGQMLAYVGDSGNAEDVGSHCHFELWGPEGCINPASSLRRAQWLETPRAFPDGPDWKPEAGETRWDGVVYSTDTARGLLVVDVASTTRSGKNGLASIPATKPRLVWLSVRDARFALRDAPDTPITLAGAQPGQPVTVVGREGKAGKASTARIAAVAKPAPVAVAQERGNPRFPQGQEENTPPANEEIAPRRAPMSPLREPEHSPVEAELVRLINEYRRSKGVVELAVSPRLIAAARRHARDMADNNLSGHVGSNRSDVTERVAATGYRAAFSTQQVARGPRFPTATDFFDAMLRSGRLNQENLLDARLREIGVSGLAFNNLRTGERDYVWTLVMAAPSP